MNLPSLRRLVSSSIPGGGGHGRGDGDHRSHQGGQGRHQRVPGERGPQGPDSVVRQPAAVPVHLPPLR